MGETTEQYKIQLLHLGRHSVDNIFIPMPIHASVPRCNTIYIFLTFFIPKQSPFCLNDTQRRSCRFMLSQRMPQVFFISYKNMFQFKLFCCTMFYVFCKDGK